MLPLSELISSVYGNAVSTKTVWGVYNKMLKTFGNEFNILLDTNREQLNQVNSNLTEIILQNREGKIKVNPGYDGVYGKAIIKESSKITKKLGDFKKKNSGY